ncbi:MAG: hypothetical protein QM520_00645 [Gammaproteobacteria bacterium]|nr:hypothetical protein [Gammaproteobacteria bacterium]
MIRIWFILVILVLLLALWYFFLGYFIKDMRYIRKAWKVLFSIIGASMFFGLVLLLQKII